MIEAILNEEGGKCKMKGWDSAIMFDFIKGFDGAKIQIKA
jgi:hypothetical protein